ncbi:AMP-binding protein [Spirosoma sp. BT702]|uniref:AMP-binding protein n=1 Tax=Spirosoma profusum TaxID=2771354 RepID=A0A926XXQ4_9BACT|nr:AMP-binding protein [Spirosoma profusum]MBD2701986.1 AMP-binding protein [Spirosoma profusum]
MPHAYQTEAQEFCQSWLSGQTLFTLHTSGSTGTPKPIQLTRAQMQASARLTGRTLGLQAGDTSLVCLNIRYVAGIMMLVRGLELGLSMTIIEPSSNPLADFDPTNVAFDFTALVPLQLQTILTQTPEKLPILNRMKAILVGGAATSPALEEALQVITSPVYATYGMTETVSHIALRRLNGPTATTVFTALEGVELGTDDRECLHIRSAATNFDLIQTNDVVELIDATHFRLLGRADTIINSGGVKIQPEQVEQIISNVLGQAGLFWRVLVVGRPDALLGQRVTALYEATEFARTAFFDEENVAQAIRQQLGTYAVPKESIFLRTTFVETATGKIDRKATEATVFSRPQS